MEVPALSERTYIGLDVHARSIVGCALNVDTGEIQRIRFEDDQLGVSQWVQGFAPAVRVVYEAGPTGFGLARHFRNAGIGCVIAAPSKLLRAPGDRIKTDRCDAKILASMLALGEVVEVRIPDPVQEALRTFHAPGTSPPSTSRTPSNGSTRSCCATASRSTEARPAGPGST